jgi:hypothetical protein
VEAKEVDGGKGHKVEATNPGHCCEGENTFSYLIIMKKQIVVVVAKLIFKAISSGRKPDVQISTDEHFKTFVKE